MLEWCTAAHEHGVEGRNGIYHRKLALLARALLHLADRPNGDKEWLDSCWITDAIKCSTLCELGGVVRRLASNCRPFLRDEIRLLRPAVLIALGGSAEICVRAAEPGIPVVRFRHPARGCPRLTATSQDESFGEVIRQLRSSGLTTKRIMYAKSNAFMRIREELVKGAA